MYICMYVCVCLMNEGINHIEQPKNLNHIEQPKNLPSLSNWNVSPTTAFPSSGTAYALGKTTSASQSSSSAGF